MKREEEDEDTSDSEKSSKNNSGRTIDSRGVVFRVNQGRRAVDTKRKLALKLVSRVEQRVVREVIRIRMGKLETC